MSSPVIIFLAGLLYAAVHSWLAARPVKAWARRKFGPAADRWYRLFYNVFAGVSGLPLLALLAVLPDRQLYAIPLPWSGVALLGQLAGALIAIVGVLQTDPWHFVGVRQLFETQPENPQPLNISGLYAWVRHPLYTGGLLFIWFTPFMTVNLFSLYVLFTLYLFVGAKLEEQRLIHEFGAAYRAYQQRVPMLIPRLRRSR